MPLRDASARVHAQTCSDVLASREQRIFGREGDFLTFSTKNLLLVCTQNNLLPLTGDYIVTYSRVMDDDAVFKALADPTRRKLLDKLYTTGGLTQGQLEEGLGMTRFGVAKHLRILEEANLVITQRSGRQKLHYLNAVPIRRIHDRWIDKYTAHQSSALLDLQKNLEEKDS